MVIRAALGLCVCCVEIISTWCMQCSQRNVPFIFMFVVCCHGYSYYFLSELDQVCVNASKLAYRSHVYVFVQ